MTPEKNFSPTQISPTTNPHQEYDHYQHYRSFEFQSLTEDQLNLLHEASLEIMTRTGMRFHHPEALELFKKAGAVITDHNLVKIPSYLVTQALQSAPKNVPIYDQTGQKAMSLGGYHSYFGVGSDCMHIYDLETRQRRKAVLQDVINGVRLVDSLPNLDFVMSMFLPSDVPEETYERHQMKVMLTETTKPIVFVGIEAASTVNAIHMASLAAGGLKALQRQPFIINYVNTVSAFQHNQESLERLLYAAERGIPSIYAPGNTRGTTAPITPAGALALGNAGQLAGLVLSQLKQEGAPFIRSNPSGGSLDMRSLVSLYANPDQGPFGWELAHHQGLPIFGTAGCSDAKIFDSQAATEAALSLFANFISGANLIHDIGYLDCAMTGSLELVVLCDEIISWLRRYLRKLEINEDTLALDLIHEIGPDEYFLETEHTWKHVRDDWMPTLFDRASYEHWTENGQTTLEERANHKVQHILDHYQPQHVPEGILKALESALEI